MHLMVQMPNAPHGCNFKALEIGGGFSPVFVIMSQTIFIIVIFIFQ